MSDSPWILHYWAKFVGRAEFVRLIFEEVGDKIFRGVIRQISDEGGVWRLIGNSAEVYIGTSSCFRSRR